MQFDLVFEGGGAKGTVFVGAMQEFAKRGHAARRFVGTSAGAITATLMAAGFNSAEMLAAVNEKTGDGRPRFSTFMDIPTQFELGDIHNSLTYDLFKKVDLPWIPGMAEDEIDERIVEQLMKLDAYREIFSFVERGGLYAGDKFLAWLGEKLNQGGRDLGKATLSQFHLKTGSDLSVIVSDTEDGEIRILNHRTAPDCPVAWAVRMSMSIPFVWQEVRWRPEWGKYRGEDISGHTIVDGGVLSNFPINLISSGDDEVKAVMGDTDPLAVPNLGLLIDETKPVAGSGKAADSTGGGLLDNVMRLKTVRRIRRLVDTMTNAHDLLVIEAHAGEVCRLPAQGYGTTEFDMNEVRLQALLRAGQAAMQEHLDARGY
jgi:predicted acylesterase/phospholipase RssA